MIQPGLGNRLIYDVTHRGLSAWLLSFLLSAFYLDLYFTEHLTGIAQSLEVIYGNVEKSLDLACMKIHSHNAIGTG